MIYKFQKGSFSPWYESIQDYSRPTYGDYLDLFQNVQETLSKNKRKISTELKRPSVESLTKEQQKDLKELETIAKFNIEHNTNLYKIEQIPEAEKLLEDKQSALETEEWKKQHPKRATIIDAINAASTAAYGDSPYVNNLRSKGLYNQANDVEQTLDKKKGVISGILLATPLFLSGIAADFSTGLLGGLGKFGGGLITSEVAGKGGERVGQWIDQKVGLNNTFKPILKWTGYLGGWAPGAKLGYDLAKSGLSNVFRNQIARTGSTNVPKWIASDKMREDIIKDAMKAGWTPKSRVYNSKQLSNIDDQGYGMAFKNGGVIKLQAAGIVPRIARNVIPKTFSRIDPWMIDWMKPGTDDFTIREYLNAASEIGRVRAKDPGGIGVDMYRQIVSPTSSSRDLVFDLGAKVGSIMGDGFDYTNIVTPERMREMIRRVSDHPFVQKLQGFVINPNSQYGQTHSIRSSSDGTVQSKVINMPFDIDHMYWDASDPYLSPELALSIRSSSSDGSVDPKSIFEDLSPFISTDKISDVLNTHTKYVDGKYIPDKDLFSTLSSLYERYKLNNPERAQTLEDQWLQLEKDAANQQRGRRMFSPINDPELAESRIVETNKSADSEKVTLHMGAKYGINVDDSGRKIITPGHNIEVIPVLRFEKNPTTGQIESVPVRSSGNLMHKNQLVYNDGKFKWGWSGEKSLVAPLTESSYNDAYQLFSDDILNPLNKSIKRINDTQGTQIRPATMVQPSFDAFAPNAGYGYGIAKPFVNRDLVLLRYNTIPSKQ